MIKAFSLPCFEPELPEESSDSDDDEMVDDCDSDTSELLYHEIDETCQHVRCFAHTLQLVIKDGFKQVGTIGKVLGKASAIVSHQKVNTCCRGIGVRKSFANSYCHAMEFSAGYDTLDFKNSRR